jgi:hypothetical protein
LTTFIVVCSRGFGGQSVVGSASAQIDEKAEDPVIKSLALSTTLADLFTPLFFADLSSAVRATPRRRSNDEFDDGLAAGL